ncbi:unnamed protein product, partial [Ectocarpus sp. 12 AP-2014]
TQGISFNDHYARGVLCVGIPYPNLGDPKIVAKKCYNDWKSLGRKPEAKDRGGAGRRSWPDLRSPRDFSQALGRCIRHVYDYGVICLIDERIRAGEWKHVKFLAKWMRDLRGDYPSFEHVVDTMDQ